MSLTFDDGLQDQYTLLRPELNRRGLRATFAIVGSKVGSTMHSSQDKAMGISGTPCMTWDLRLKFVKQLFDEYKPIKLMICRTFTDTNLRAVLAM